MRILIEEYQYTLTDENRQHDLKCILKELGGFENVEGKISINYVGYYYSAELKDCVFILPKVLINVDENKQELVFGECHPEDIINIDKDSPLKDEQKRFIYEFAVWIYRAIDVYRKQNKKSGIIYYKHIAEMSKGRRRVSNTFLDVLLSLIKFNKDNQNFFFFILKNQHSGLNKINWTKTISKSQAFVQDNAPVYLDPVNKKRQINFDEELLVIFFSILNYINDKYGFSAEININFPLITKAQFENYLRGMGKVRLHQIKYKYFSDKAIQLWELCYAFFDRSHQINISSELQDYLLAKDFNIVFEAMIDELVGDNKDDLPADFKEQKDGKLVDHLYTYPGLIEADDKQRTYYIGDSKYYKLGAQLGETSIYKQYTYARNIVQYNIDLWLDSKVPNPDIKLRDDITEGYNIIPNFFISAAMKPGDYSYNHREIELTKTGRKNPEIKYQFKDRLFDRDTMLLSRYNVNFLFVISLYARNRQSEKDVWKEEVRKQFREQIRNVLEHEYSFFPMRSKGVHLDEYMTRHFRQLNGKVFTPFQDKSILTLALHTPNGKHLLTSEQATLVEMLKTDFDIDENYTLGKEPQLPPPTVFQFQVDDYVLVGYYKDEEQLNWILEKKLYNVRAGKDRGTLDLTPSVCAAKYMLLYGKNGIYKFKLKANTVRVWSKLELEQSGYNNPRHDFYLMFFIDEQIVDGEFAQMVFDLDELKNMLNKNGKDNAGHDKGAFAVKFSELISCKAL